MAEVPDRIEQHVRVRLEGEKNEFVPAWEEFVESLESWLVQLKDLPESSSEEGPFQDPQVRKVLLFEALPMARHMVEDYLVLLLHSLDPAKMVGLSKLSNRVLERQRDIVSGCVTLRYLLEDWGELPSVLLPLQLLLPRNENVPNQGLRSFLSPMQTALQEVRNREEFWLLATTSLHALAFAPWAKNSSWRDRYRLLQLLDRRIEAADSPAPNADRERLEGRLLVEVVRLTRTLGGEKPPEELRSWFLKCLRRVRSRTKRQPLLTYAVLWNTFQVCRTRKCVYYDPEVPPEVLKGIYQTHLSTPFIVLHKELYRKGLVPVGLAGLPTPLPPRR
jgi:hypothetical protein